MRALKEIPEISWQSFDNNDNIELEVKGKIAPLPDNWVNEEIVFLGRMARTIYLVTGHLLAREYVSPERTLNGEDFTTLSIKGSIITFNSVLPENGG
jgi:hypothetical protein